MTSALRGVTKKADVVREVACRSVPIVERWGVENIVDIIAEWLLSIASLK